MGKLRYEVGLGEIVHLLVRNVKNILIFTIAVAFVAGVIGFALPRTYEASAMIVVKSRQSGNTTVTNVQSNSSGALSGLYDMTINKEQESHDPGYQLNMNARLASMCEGIVTSDVILQPIIDEIGIDVKYNELKDKVTVNAVGDTQFVQIAVEQSKPDQAEKICSKIVEQAPEVLQSALEAESVEVFSPVRIDGSSRFPVAVQFAVFGAVLAFLLRVTMVVFSYLKDDRIRTSMDISRYVGVKVLGVIPATEKGSKNV